MQTDSAIMPEALHIFKEVQYSTGLSARLQHLTFADNSISDNFSRGAILITVHEEY